MEASPTDKSTQVRGDVLDVVTSRREARAFYNRLSPLYEFLTERWEGPVRKQGLDLLQARQGEEILEIGVGTGHGVLAIAEAVGPTGRVFGIDIAERMIAAAKTCLARAGLFERVEITCGDATALPYAAGAVDAVFMSFTLELFDTPEIPLVLAECRRVLRPGGRIVVVSLSRSLGSTLPVRLYEWGHRKLPRLLDCRPVYVERSIRDAGFRIERVEMTRVAGLPVELVRGKTF